MTQERDFSNFSMLDLFNMEVKAQAVVLNECLLALETKAYPSDELAALMRAAHSIKGAARIVQMDAAVTLAHAMEDCFVAAQGGKITLTGSEIDILLQAVDMLLHMAEVNVSGTEPPDQQTIQDLVKAIANILIPPPPRPPIIQPLPTPAEVPTEIYELPVVEVIPEIEPPESKGHESLTPVKETSTTVVSTVSTPATEKIDIGQKRVVRVSAENLNRLMGLAGESLVEAKWLESFADSLLNLKSNQVKLAGLLDRLQELWSHSYEQSSENSRYWDRHIEEQMSTARQTANECRQLLGDRHNELELFCQRFSNLSDRLYRQVIATHMSPFAERGQSFPRMVRDLSRQLGKRVKLEIIGKSTLVDRDILESLEAPLIHILRNAIDHGIETPQERLAAGKPEEGTIRIEVFHRAGMLLINIADDGRGIDIEMLRQEVVHKNLTNPEMAAQLSESELMDFLFLPGFSTAENVTEFSGRGVGLDVVHSTVREIGGTFRAVSQPGKGMTLHLQLPLTLSVLRTLLVEIAHEPYAFGLARIDRVVMLPKSEIILSENQPFFLLNNQPVALISAHQVLDLPPQSSNQEFLPVVVISDNTAMREATRSPTAIRTAGGNRLHHYGLVVDRFIGECSLVVRPLDPRLGKVPNISAAALMDDGSPVLIIDVEDMARSIAKVLASGQLSQVNQSTQQSTTKTYKRVLVVDDSITVREMERKLLENNGYKVDVAVNGMDGWNAVRSGNYDLVVTDIDMPRMNGFELTSQIRANGKLKAIPVIIVSYKDREEDRVQGLEAGANYYLTKSSFHDRTLLKAVVDLIGEA
ncbi:chemotaxis protein, histidine kinase family [Richelia sinica FACHB-800]|uniref:histidine kinase n=1 Tax=Richelia sinica FACHB-800 TaxID=1357546 RepID=A0A975T510_9NOST|nr:hybrid sensor histidine kinase/response regulator [Richelia sinica]MBD2667133.1 hybrid sensor histidine kinase/response regulator [Richelia sinica FACHB-800]QXE21557.1 chemotaxis protein, histidine kinase family [Richelia sinica FACHB-800]